jgi:DNA-binding NarL/FixJ family response regulator
VTTAVSAAFLGRSTPWAPADVIAIVSDRRLSVAALTAVLLQDRRYGLLAEERGAEGVRAALRCHRPVLTVVETAGPVWDALPAEVEIGQVLLLVDPDDDPAILARALRSDAAGYLSRSASGGALQIVIESIRKTGGYQDPLLLERLGPRADSATAAGAERLSQRQHDILVRIASGWSTKEVAREYAITPKTVGNHINHIYRRLNLRRRGELVIYAAQQGLTTTGSRWRVGVPKTGSGKVTVEQLAHEPACDRGRFLDHSAHQSECRTVRRVGR